MRQKYSVQKKELHFISVLNYSDLKSKYFVKFCIKKYRELAHEYTDLFHPEYKKHKSQALLDWAKKKLGKIKQSTYNKIPDDPNEEISDEEFNIKKMNKMMSSPLKLKV